MKKNDHFDVVIVGAGFAGLFALHRFQEMGLRVRVFEAGSGVGGTWFWNRYPGARCDIESMEYSYQFDEALQQEWEWTERYATQPEILNYLNHVADRFELRNNIQLNTRVNSVHYDEGATQWNITTETESVTAKYCVMATGVLSSANSPQFEGREKFEGEQYHTGKWPHDGVDFSGKRVAVIGTGSSGIQAIPIIAEQCKELTVFQRTPSYSVPAQNKQLEPEAVKQIKANYSAFRAANAKNISGANFRDREELALEASEEERRLEYDARWQMGGLPFLGAYADLYLDEKANQTAANYVRTKISELVEDSELAKILTPDSPIGCKRLCSDTGYYQTFNQAHVNLVDVSKQKIERITKSGVVVGDTEYDADIIVYATGFDAMTGALNRIDIRGRGQLCLEEKWSSGPKTYLGLSVSGFPNMFIVAGPGSPSVLTNMVSSIEQHVNWISNCVQYMESRQESTIEALESSEEKWVAHVNAIAGMTIFPNCNSWYLGANVPGKPRVFMPCLGFPDYVVECDRVVANDYEGFVLN